MNGGTVLGGAFIVAGLFHGYLVIRLWRNPAKAARLVDTFSSVFPYSDKFCRGMVRASAAITGGVTTAGLFAVLGQATMTHQTGTLGRDLLDAMITSLVAVGGDWPGNSDSSTWATTDGARYLKISSITHTPYNP
ncbi:hypothetical protein RKD27_009307 [Streptomyces sp. SAI-126]|uniref:hypothetical protein n=1 Tax=unclassified Streptomyces TaxID=2593676 RepID=UPI0024731B34|nr:hypothetical protein [Streptomyces sp. SAI-119]MDH6455554.1 hypothetical protein [Streptomyces sp. SAI-119]